MTEPAEEPEPEPQQKSNTGTLLLILAVAVLGGGAGWYLKIYRPKHEKAAVPEEDYSEELADYDDPEEAHSVMLTAQTSQSVWMAPGAHFSVQEQAGSSPPAASSAASRSASSTMFKKYV